MWAWPWGISHLGNSFSKVLVHETPIFHYCCKLPILPSENDNQSQNLEGIKYTWYPRCPKLEGTRPTSPMGRLHLCAQLMYSSCWCPRSCCASATHPADGVGQRASKGSRVWLPETRRADNGVGYSHQQGSLRERCRPKLPQRDRRRSRGRRMIFLNAGLRSAFSVTVLRVNNKPLRGTTRQTVNSRQPCNCGCGSTHLEYTAN